MNTLQEEDETHTTASSGRAIRLPELTPLQILGIAVAVLVVAALIISLIEWSNQNSKVGHYQHIESLRTSASKAASQYGVDFGSYDYRNLHSPTAPWTQLENASTTKFRSDYQKTTSALEPTIVAYKATAKATVPVAAVSSLSSSKAVVLLLLDQKITNSTQKNGPQAQQFIVQMFLVLQHGHWLIDNVQASL